MRFRGAILATTLLATPVSVMAQPITGLYVGAGAGLHAPQDPRVTANSRAFGNGRLNFSEEYGFNSNLAIGYGLGNGFRFEVEGDFARSDLRHLQGTPFPTAASGTIRTWGVMANAIFDMDVGFPWVYPYLGIGAGYQWTRLNNVGAVQRGGGPFAFSADSQSGAFAGQAIAGASFPIPNVPGLSLTADYRFMDILGGEKYAVAVANGGLVAPAQFKVHNQYRSRCRHRDPLRIQHASTGCGADVPHADSRPSARSGAVLPGVF